MPGDDVAINRKLIRLNEQFEGLPFDRLSPPERVFSVVWRVESEVNNGGFSLLFANCGQEEAKAAADSLGAIGAPTMAAIVADAMLVLASDFDRSKATPREEVRRLGKMAQRRLDVLTDRFLRYPENLTGLLYEYVRANSARFRGVAADF